MRVKINWTTYRILSPEIKKIQTFMDFHEYAVRLVVRHVSKLIQPEKKKEVHSGTHTAAPARSLAGWLGALSAGTRLTSPRPAGSHFFWS